MSESLAGGARVPLRSAAAGDSLGLVDDEVHVEADPVISLHRRSRTRARSRSDRQTLPREAAGLLPIGPAETLAAARAARQAVVAAQVAELVAVAAWADHHTADGLAARGAGLHGDPDHAGEQLVAVAGDGAPEVAEFCVPELALALGVSTDSARLLLADAVELAHRLPTCWRALQTGGVPVFRARRVAQATRDLNPAAAAHVDREVAPHLHTVGTKALDAIVEAATWAHDLPRALAETRTALDRRGLTIDLDNPGTGGSGGSGATCSVWGELDRADAVELERAVADLAHHLHLAGSTETLEVRRSMALGMLARRETPISIPDQTPDATAARAAHDEWDDLECQPDHEEAPVVLARHRDVVLHVHLTDDALRTGTGIAALDGSPHPVSVDQVRGWCAAPGTTTRVTLRPVIDLGVRLASPGHDPSPDLAEQVVTRDRTCVFPHCTRSARACDLDHTTPYEQGGTTSSDNLAALCRRHHRLKTHHPGWSYVMLHPGTYLWTTPAGHQVVRDAGGSRQP